MPPGLSRRRSHLHPTRTRLSPRRLPWHTSSFSSPSQPSPPTARPGYPLAPRDHHHQSRSRRRRRLHPAQPGSCPTEPVPTTPRLLPSRSDHPPHLRLRNQDRSMAPRRGGTASSWSSATADGPATLFIPRCPTPLQPWIRRRLTNTGHDGGDASSRPATPKAGRLRLPRRPRDDRQRQGPHHRLLRSTAPAVLLERLLLRWQAGIEGSPEVPRRLRRHHRRRARQYWTHLMAGDLWPAVVTLKDPAAACRPPNSRSCTKRPSLPATVSMVSPTASSKIPPAALRPRHRPVQRRRAGRLPHRRPSGLCAQDLRRREESPDRKAMFPGMPPGSERTWPALAGAQPFGIPLSHFQHVVFNNPSWNFLTLDSTRTSPSRTSSIRI